MRRNYISPEFTYRGVFGTNNMVEQSTFFGSKMLEVEDSIYLSNNNIIYYQNLDNEQIDILIENSLNPIIYNSSENKKNNHIISIDESQNQSQKDDKTRWIINIDLYNILTNYIFASLKQARTFEGVKNNMTLYNDVNLSIREYIKSNVINRYKYSKIDFYIKYNDLRGQYALRYKNNWNDLLVDESNIIRRIQTETSYDYSNLRVIFNQEKSSLQYSFDYYFNILFEKI